MSGSAFGGAARDILGELAPVLRRVVTLDRAVLARIRIGETSATVLVALPFRVLIARTVTHPHAAHRADVVVRAADLLAWLDDETLDPPAAHDEQWRTGLPPASGWQRIDTVPDTVVRDLVRTGALALKEAAAREGVPGAQPRQTVADALLDSVVLTVSAAGDHGTGRPGGTGGTAPVEITLRALSALTRMGFLSRGSHIAVDTAGRWIRIAAEYGSAYLERAESGLNLLRP